MENEDAVARVEHVVAQYGDHSGIVMIATGDERAVLDALAAAEVGRDQQRASADYWHGETCRLMEDAMLGDKAQAARDEAQQITEPWYRQYQAASERLAAAEAERDRWHREYRELFDEIKAEREVHGQELAHLGQRARGAEAERDGWHRLAEEYARRNAAAAQQLAATQVELADERRKMHVYGPDNQVTHCGCRLCGERQAQSARLEALEAERDQTLCSRDERHELADESKRLAERRSADYTGRLEALEAAARAWDVAQTTLQAMMNDPTVDDSDPPMWDAIMGAEAAGQGLHAALANLAALAAPPGEEA